jgi:hypothetical protein
MNITVEQSIKSWMDDASSLSGKTILCGQSDDEMPNDAEYLMVDCSNTQADAPSLYIATVRILVSSPCVMEDALDNHRATVATLRELIRVSEGMETYFPSNLACKGVAVNGWNDSQMDERWVSSVNLSVGLVDLYG